MLAMMRLSSGTDGTNVVGDGVSVRGCLVVVGSEDSLRVGVEGGTVREELAGLDMQALSPDISTKASSNLDVEGSIGIVY